MIGKVCPRGHLIASVDVTDDAIVPVGLQHGLTWDYLAEQNRTRLQATCATCTYDGSVEPSTWFPDYEALHQALTVVVADGGTEYSLTD